MTLKDQIRSAVRFPFELICILFMIFVFGWESTNRMFDYEKMYLEEKERMLKKELNNAKSTKK